MLMSDILSLFLGDRNFVTVYRKVVLYDGLSQGGNGSTYISLGPKLGLAHISN